MKAIKILFLSVFLIFLINTASAVVVYGEWDSNQAQSISIEDGDSVDFSAFFGTISPPMAISVKLYDSGNDLIHTFEDTEINQNSFAQIYIVNQDIYSRPGDFQVRILGSDNFGEMSAVLYLDVINYPPVINSDPVLEVDESGFYSYDVEAVDPDNHVLTYSLSAPEWLSINSGSGLITGTAPDVSEDTDFDVSVVVSDGIDIATQSYTLKIIWIPKPSLTQTVELVENDVKVEYNAVLYELNSAILEIYYKELGSPEPDYELIETRNIDTPSYNETFDFYNIHQKTKGDYLFIIQDPVSGISETDEIPIPDYPPVVDLSSISADFDEEDTIVINLPAPTDINPEDEPVAYINATPDEKITTSLNGNILTVEGKKDKTGNYTVELWFGDPDGAKANAFLSGYIDNLIDVSGVLENNEQDTGTQGVIRVYYINPENESDYLPLEINQIYEGALINASLRKIQTTSNGTFNFQINKKASELEEIILQARIGEPENYTSYVRTISFPGEDYTITPAVRAVPYAPYENDPVIFREFMYELGGSPPNTRFDFEGEYIKDGEFDPEYWPDLVNYTGLIGIEILSENPFGEEYGIFTPEEQINIKNKILNSTDISGIIGNYTINGDDVHILTGNQSGHYDLYDRPIVYGKTGNETVVAHPGWIIVVPYSNMPYNGLAEPRKAGTLVYKGSIYLYPSIGLGFISNHTISHEFGHMFIGSGHPVSMHPNQSVMISGSGIYLQTTGPADKKAGKLIYEETYMTFSLVLFPELDSLYNILGLGFYGEEGQGTMILNENYFVAEEDEEEDLIGGRQDSDEGSVEDSVIDFDNTGSSNGVNANTPYDGTIHLQSNADKNNIVTSLSNIIRQVISFISQKLKSIF